MKVFIDPGHNHTGGDTGAVGYGLKEQDVTYKIAEILGSLLISCGHTVKLSRNSPTESVGATVASSLSQRVKKANEWPADLCISIHCNAYNTLARGTETLVYSKNSAAYPTALQIQNAIVKTLGTADRGVKERPDLAVLRKTNMPSILVETAFIDNLHDNALLKNHPRAFAEAIACGILGKIQDEMGKTDMAEAEAMTAELNERFFPILDPQGFAKALLEAKKSGSPLYWGYDKLLDKR